MAAFLRSRQQETILVENVAAALGSLYAGYNPVPRRLNRFPAVLDTQTARLLAEQRHVSARSSTVRGAIGVYRALGGGWQIR